MAIPCTLRDDEELVQTLCQRYGGRRWMLIPNTLHVGKIYVSADLASELRNHPRCRVSPRPSPLVFRQGRLQLFA
jgi:hypothetical protein